MRAAAREWPSSVAAVRALDDVALSSLAVTLAAVPLAAMTVASQDLYLLTKSEISIRRVEASLAVPAHPQSTETAAWPP